jgi:nucleotide-binding universal stress UspA family protein
MTILVGYPLKRRAKAVLSLAGMLARTGGQDLVVCIVIPAPWMPGLSRADQGYRAYIDELVDNAIAQAREDMPADVSAQFTTIQSKSAPNGLLESALQHDASVIVTGSSDSGQFGYISLSSVADRLLHSSHVPVAVAPRGFRASGSKIKRITLAFTGGSQSSLMLVSARALAAEYGCELRLASFAVHLSPPETARFRDEHGAVLAEWTEDIYAAAEKALAPAGGEQATRPDIVIGHGRDWDEAFESIEWEPGEVLVIGSSETGPVARVFLGSRATKIVRHAPVPVIVVPRSAAEELAEEVQKESGDS